MTLDEINQQLANLAVSGDQDFANAANYIAQASQAAQSGQLTPQELVEILRDMQRQTAILEDVSRLAFKETLNSCINGLLLVAGAVL
jgi:hypothetical protein